MGIDLGRFKAKKDDEWDEWLKDDPIPSTIRNRMRNQAVQQASQPRVRRVSEHQQANALTAAKTPQKQAGIQPKDTTVSIHISIPKFRALKANFKTLFARIISFSKGLDKKILVGGAAVFVIGIGGISFALLYDGKNPDDKPAVLAGSTEKANFEYSLPDGDATGADGEIKYDSTKNIVNFKDEIGGVPITISQQPLPSSFKDDTDAKVKKLAEDFSATKTIATANPTAYIGTSIKGPQTVIFSKKDLLVFIQSTKVIEDRDWAEYITNLK